MSLKGCVWVEGFELWVLSREAAKLEPKPKHGFL